MSLSVPFSALAATLVLAVPAVGATAVPFPAGAITHVTVYAGAASVERTHRLPPGGLSVTFDCLSAALDVKSLQVEGERGVQIGELDVRTTPRSLAPQCDLHPLDARIEALEAARDAAQSETDALNLVTGYLKRVGEGVQGDRPVAATPPSRIVEVTQTLRRTGQDALQRQRALVRRIAEFDRQLKPLEAERAAARGASGDRVMSVRVAVAGPTAADVRLRYIVAGATWAPTYRALLDGATGRVRLERQARVTQATGEAWRGISLRLSTGQPRRTPAGAAPTPWHVGVAEPAKFAGDRDAFPVAAQATPRAPMVGEADAGVGRSHVMVTRMDTPFDTLFDVPQALDVPSGADGVTVALGAHESNVRLVSRVSPQQEAAAYLVADLAVPDGVWPSGPLQLYRDGAFVGDTRFSVVGVERLALPFGRDDLVRVTADPERDTRGTAGFGGGRVERTVRRGYAIENRHVRPVAVELLDAAPVAVDDRVKVTTTFAPEPVEREWQRQPGVARWVFDLAPGQATRVEATHVISHPKALALTGR